MYGKCCLCGIVAIYKHSFSWVCVCVCSLALHNAINLKKSKKKKWNEKKNKIGTCLPSSVNNKKNIMSIHKYVYTGHYVSSLKRKAKPKNLFSYYTHSSSFLLSTYSTYWYTRKQKNEKIRNIIKITYETYSHI